MATNFNQVLEIHKGLFFPLLDDHDFSTPNLMAVFPRGPQRPVHTGDKVEFNTVDFVRTRLLPKPATNRQQSELGSLSRSTLFPIRSTSLPVCTGPKRHGRLYQFSTKSTVLNSTLSPVCTEPNGDAHV